MTAISTASGTWFLEDSFFVDFDATLSEIFREQVAKNRAAVAAYVKGFKQQRHIRAARFWSMLDRDRRLTDIQRVSELRYYRTLQKRCWKAYKKLLANPELLLPEEQIWRLFSAYHSEVDFYLRHLEFPIVISCPNEVEEGV
jgi:hypothetical protein